MLGKDAAKSEYWHFKDDNQRLYIRMEEEVPVQQENVEMLDDDQANHVREVQASSDAMNLQKDSTQVESKENQQIEGDIAENDANV